MEDPESEWKIQEYYSSSSNSKENDEDDKPSMVRRILTNGYVIGKEFVITGIFISSAPLIVPPLVVVSAVGFVFTVPFGVLLTSYACTNKIMSMLLPAPVPSPLRLEYYCNDEVEQEDYERMDCKLGLGLGFDDVVVEKNEGDYGAEMKGYFTDKKDNEVVEDVNEEVEMEIVFELGDDSRQEGETLITNMEEDVDGRGMDKEDDMLQREINDTEEKEREQMEDVEQGVEMRSSFDVVGDGDQGYEEDAGEYLEGDYDGLEEEHKGEKLLVDDRQEVDEDPKVMKVGRVHVHNMVEDDCIVSEGGYNVVLGDVETTKPVTSESASNVVFGDIKDVEITKLVTSESASIVGFGDAKDVETNKPVTSVDASDVVFGDVTDVETTKPVTSESYSNVVFGDDEDVGISEPVTVIEIELEKLVEKGSKNDEPVGEVRRVVVLSDGNEANNFNSQVVDKLDLVAREVIGDANADERNIESDERVLRESMGTKESNGGDEYKDGSKDGIMITIEEHLNHSDADAWEIDEDNLLDERNTNNNLEVGNEVKENADVDDVDVLACAPSKCNTDNGNEANENAVDDNVKCDTDNGNEVKENAADICNEVKKNADDDNVDVLVRIPSKQDTDNAKVMYKKMSSREENLDDEKIWEKIAAMRTIVGYKAPTQPTCIGELKALYVFTGVEPPASFDGDSDLDAKIKFLMAIVGVK